MPKRGGSRGKGNKASVSSLIPQFPNEEDLDAISSEILHGSDYSAAILACSQLHRALAIRVMDKFMWPSDPPIHDLLHGRDGPLHSLYSTSILAYVLGVIEYDEFKDIGVLRRIRNVFAHSSLHLTFDNPLIAAECNKLELRPVFEVPPDAPPRFAYLRVAVEIVQELWAEGAAESVRRRRNAKRRVKRRAAVRKRPS